VSSHTLATVRDLLKSRRSGTLPHVERMMSTTHDLSAVDVRQWLRATHLLLIAAEDVKV
jgi:hypothetical protein